MISRSKGQFYGNTNQTIHLGGLTITDTEYLYPSVDWHYHENAYFTFIIQGHVLEGNKKEVYYCSAGDLLFHNWQEAHYNRKPAGFTRGFHIEIDKEWFSQYDLKTSFSEGSRSIKQPDVRLQMYRIFAATKLQIPLGAAEVDSQLLQLLTTIDGIPGSISAIMPPWVKRLQQLLTEEPESHSLSLAQLAQFAEIHPAHLSRAFPIYFHCQLGDYLRQLKITRALGLLADKRHSLASIAADCGFADQSHFIRLFKQHQQMTPLAYRKLTGAC